MSLTFDFIGIVTRDLTASLAFYRVLGLDIPEDAESAPHVEVVLPSGMKLAWDTLETIRGFDPEYVEQSGDNRISFAFQAESPAEVDESYAALIAAGYESRREPWDAFWGQRYATVADPDGNPVDLYAALA